MHNVANKALRDKAEPAIKRNDQRGMVSTELP